MCYVLIINLTNLMTFLLWVGDYVNSAGSTMLESDLQLS